MDKEKVELQLKFTPNYKKYSILLNCYRVGGMKWNDVDGAIFHKIDLCKEDVLFALGVKQKIADLEAKLAESENLMRKYGFENFEQLKDGMHTLELYVKEAGINYNKQKEENKQLKQQLAEKDAEVQSWKDGTMVVKLGKLEEQLAEKDKVIENLRIDLKDWQDLEEKLGTKYDKVVEQLAEKDQAIESLQEINQSLGQTCNNDAKEIERLREQLAEKEKEIEIEKKVSDWLYNIQNRTKFEEEVTQKYKTATEITKQCNLYEHCKNQYINDLRSEVKKKLKD